MQFIKVSDLTNKEKNETTEKDRQDLKNNAETNRPK
jgi:hypothetical protein